MDPDVRAQRPPRRTWTIIAWAGGAVFVLLCAVFAVPMVIDFRQEAPQANPPTLRKAWR